MPRNNTRTLLSRRFAVVAGSASLTPPTNGACVSFKEEGRKKFIVWSAQFTEEFAALQVEIKQGVQHQPRHTYATKTTAERIPGGYLITMAYIETESW